MSPLKVRSTSHSLSRHPTPAMIPGHVRVLTRGRGVFMLAMAGVNGWLAATGQAHLYADFADAAYLDLYRDVWEALVGPHPLPWVLALTVFEGTAGAATLTSGRARLIGLGTTAAFILALTPGNADTLGNPLLAALPAYLLTRHVRAGRGSLAGALTRQSTPRTPLD